MSHSEPDASRLDDEPGEEFDPRGTLALLLAYFLLLVVLWIHLYFVEFLGNDLVVVG